MATVRSLAQLLTASRRLASQDQLGTGPLLVTDDEQAEYVQESLSRLWDMLAENGGEALLSKRVEITADADGEVLLPDDFHKLLRLDVQDGTKWRLLDRLRDEDQADAEEWADGLPRAYAIRGAHQLNAPVRVYPSAVEDQVFRMEYVPEPPVLADEFPADPPIPAVDISLPNRWWSWIQYDVAIEMAGREESDTSHLERRRDAVGVLILKSAVSTDHGAPRKVQDARGVLPGNRRRFRPELVGRYRGGY